VRHPELSETLTALVSAVACDGSVASVEVDITVPMEVTLSIRDEELIVHAAPGHTRFTSGFLPPVHQTRLYIVAAPTASDPTEAPSGWSS
jgi:hypothetical protein